MTEPNAPTEAVSPYWGWRGNRRPDPRFGPILNGFGGLAVGVGAVTFAGDQFGHDRKYLGAAMCFAALVAAVIGAKFLRDPFRAACAGLVVPTVYGGWAMLLFSADDTGVTEIKMTFLFASLTYFAIYFAPPLRGRGIFLAIALLGIWMLGVVQVGDNAFSKRSVGRVTQGSTVRDHGPAGQAAKVGGLPDRRVPAVACDDPSYAETFPEECGGSVTSSSSPSYDPCDRASYADAYPEECGGSVTSSSSPSYDPCDRASYADAFPEVCGGSSGGSGNLNITSSDPFDAVGRAGSDFGNNVSWLTLIFGGVYLLMGVMLDRKRRTGFATPFFGTALLLFPLGAALTSFDFDSRSGGSAARFGAQWIAAGVILCAVGAKSVVTRRATTWIGGFAAAVGSATWISDLIRPKTTNGAALTALIIGGVLMLIGFAGSILLKEGSEGPSPDGPDLILATPEGPGPEAPSSADQSATAVAEPVQSAVTWGADATPPPPVAPPEPPPVAPPDPEIPSEPAS
ncbi:MAG: hypothetical protein WBD02_10915 [Acidimicrobiia bacterium]